jgi:hypothetical protein
MKKWSETGLLRNVVSQVRRNMNISQDPTFRVYPTLMFRGTIKLHGTNASIRRTDGQYFAQSRERILTLDSDNYGFASWVHRSILDPVFKAELDAMFNRVCSDPTVTVTIYGEWAGAGVQKNVGISKIDTVPHFFIFGAIMSALRTDEPLEIDIKDISATGLRDEDVDDTAIVGNEDDEDTSIIHTRVRNSLILNMETCDRVHNILQFPMFFVSIDFNAPQLAIDTITSLTEQVENECPVAKHWGIENGIGEGLVWECMDVLSSRLNFKSKGEKHAGGLSGPKVRNTVTIEPETLTKRRDLADYVCSAARLAQGLEHVPPTGLENMGRYIKWVSQDILKEESDTISASGFDWKDLTKHITEKVRLYFINAVNTQY